MLLLLPPPTPLLLLLLLLSAKVLTSGLIFWAVFSIHASKSKSPSILGTVESAPIDIPTIEARSSNASWLAVKSSVSSLVIPAGGLEDPLEVTSDDVDVADEEEAVSNDDEGGIFTAAVIAAEADGGGGGGGNGDTTVDVAEDADSPDAAVAMALWRGSRKLEEDF